MIRFVWATVALINIVCAALLLVGDAEVSPVLSSLDKLTLAALFAMFAARGRL